MAAIATYTAVTVSDHEGICSAANAAFEQAGEQIGWTPRLMQRSGLCCFLNADISVGNDFLLTLYRSP